MFPHLVNSESDVDLSVAGEMVAVEVVYMRSHEMPVVVVVTIAWAGLSVDICN